jgi:hypothetical protein
MLLVKTPNGLSARLLIAFVDECCAARVVRP